MGVGRAGSHGWGLTVALMLLVTAMVAAARAWSTDARQGGQGRSQIGLASFYGPGFHGQETASGEEFDQRNMTAAHRTLPLGSVVRVTNLENGRRVVVRINDRGPYGRNYRKGTIIDLSKGAARQLRFLEDGLVRVRVEVLHYGEDGAGVE